MMEHNKIKFPSIRVTASESKYFWLPITPHDFVLIKKCFSELMKENVCILLLVSTFK